MIWNVLHHGIYSQLLCFLWIYILSYESKVFITFAEDDGVIIIFSLIARKKICGRIVMKFSGYVSQGTSNIEPILWCSGSAFGCTIFSLKFVGDASMFSTIRTKKNRIGTFWGKKIGISRTCVRIFFRSILICSWLCCFAVYKLGVDEVCALGLLIARWSFDDIYEHTHIYMISTLFNFAQYSMSSDYIFWHWMWKLGQAKETAFCFQKIISGLIESRMYTAIKNIISPLVWK